VRQPRNAAALRGRLLVPAAGPARRSLLSRKPVSAFPPYTVEDRDRKLKQAGIDLLAGRAIVRTLHPFMAAELGSTFDLNLALQSGMLPLVLDCENLQDGLDSYIDVLIREEVQAEGLVRNLSGFPRFIEGISFSQGQVLNVSNVDRECEVERKTVEGYLSVLEDLLLCFRLPVFRKRAGRVTVHHPSSTSSIPVSI